MSNNAITSREVARAIHGAFLKALPPSRYRDTEVPQLSESEVFHFLMTGGLLSAADVDDPATLPVMWLAEMHGGGRVPLGSCCKLEEHVKSLKDLSGWTLADLIGVAHISPASARKVEQALALYGLSLRDGGATRPETNQPATPVAASPLSTASPEEIRTACARALVDLSGSMGRDVASVMRFASNIMAGQKVGGRIKTYANRVGVSRGAEVRRLAGPLLALEEAERPGPNSARRHAEPEAAENVIRPAFAGRAS